MFAESYNSTFYLPIKYASQEVNKDKKFDVLAENSATGKYERKFEIWNIDEFDVGDKVRIASKENLKDKTKEDKGRFIKEIIVFNKCDNDSYLVKGMANLGRKGIMI